MLHHTRLYIYVYRRVVFPRKSIPSSYTFVKPVSRPTHSSPPPTMTRVYLRIPSPFLPFLSSREEPWTAALHVISPVINRLRVHLLQNCSLQRCFETYVYNVTIIVRVSFRKGKEERFSPEKREWKKKKKRRWCFGKKWSDKGKLLNK